MRQVLWLGHPIFSSRNALNALTRKHSSTTRHDFVQNTDRVTTSEQRLTAPTRSFVFRGLPDSYELKPLSNETCTRVLTIHPSQDRSAPVALSVEEIDLAGEYQPFVAISHVWGPKPRYTRFTLCDGRPQRITGRVDSLLHRLRTKVTEQDTRYKNWNRIWIDTLCIDQADNVMARREKNHQVSMMRKIFGDAQEVVIDLGQSDRYSHLLPDAKQDIDYLRERAFDDEYCKRILGFPSSVKLDPDEALRVRQSLEACTRLLDKQWMSRIWAVQEYALARKCSFLSGTTVIDGELLDGLGRLASATNLRGPSHLALLFSKFRRSLALTKLPLLARVRDRELNTTEQLNFGTALGLGWHHECTDERDTIYALRALVNYRGQPLEVDYNEPVHLLAQRVSRKLIETGDYEALLAGARGHAGSNVEDGEPSWSFLMRPTFKFVGQERHWILSGKPNSFTAGGRTTQDPSLTLSATSSNCLQAKAIVVGIIDTISERFPEIPQYGTNSALPVQRLYAYNTERTIHTRAVFFDLWLRHSIIHLNEFCKTDSLDRTSEKLWRTVTHGYNGIELDTRDLLMEESIKYWNMLVDMSMKGLETVGYQHDTSAGMAADIDALTAAMRKRRLLLEELAQRPREWIDKVNSEFDLLGDPHKTEVETIASKAHAVTQQIGYGTSTTQDDLLRRIALNTHLVNQAFDIRKIKAMDQLKMLERRLGRLRDGRLVSVPDTTEIGDVIFLLRGISVPYVLRKGVDETYKIVGMAYVDGIMYGEAVSELTKWDTITMS